MEAQPSHITAESLHSFTCTDHTPVNGGISSTVSFSLSGCVAFHAFRDYQFTADWTAAE